MKNFNTNIQICERCRGWGTITDPYERRCPKCNGIGVTGKTDSKTIAFLAPTFVDFQKRQRNNYISRFVSTAAFIITLVFIIIFSILFSSLIT